MEGLLQQVQTGIFGGSKKVYCKIVKDELVVNKSSDKASKEMMRIQLSNCQLQLQEKAQTFILSLNDAKKKKYAFKASTLQDTRLWAEAINEFTANPKKGNNDSESDDSDKMEKKYQQQKRKTKAAASENENLFEAFHSRLFVDDCEINQKVKTLNEIQELFKMEKKALELLIADDEKYKPIKKQVQSIANLSNTMDTLISNLIEEVDDSRSQMFEILETIALEQAKNDYEKKKSKKVQKKQKTKQQVSSSFVGQNKGNLDKARVNKEATSSMQVGRSKSISMSAQRRSEPLDDLAMIGRVNSKGAGMEFEAEETKDTGMKLSSSRNSDSSSSVINMDEALLEEDDFEDAEEGFVTTISQDKQMKRLQDLIISDCDEERIALPCLRDSRLKASTLWSILKDMVGKDITKYSMPVIVNEPLSILQKAAEPLQFNYFLQQAALEDDPMMRMVQVTLFQITRNFNLIGRVTKPFNPLLGETYEVVTPTYRAIAEQVSHHPPLCCLHCQGEGYNWTKSNDFKLKFNGKTITCQEFNSLFIQLFPQCKKKEAKKDEWYTFTPNKTLIGNLIIGDTYVEPFGISKVTAYDTGYSAEVDYLQRGWSGKNKEVINAQIKNEKGEVKYELTGKYSESLTLKNVETGEEKLVWTAPAYPDNFKLMYGMNSFSLQLNLLTDKLKEKLPPTDSRLRTDMRAWEEGRMEEASDIKNQLEENQRSRKKQLKNILDAEKLLGDDCNYYTPFYFKKARHHLNDEPYYQFIEKNERGSNYWQDREKGDWKHLPNIWSDDCKPFY